jgi:DNA polymerase I-like protein with 3'-5' exonuclease and polymerase domains
MRHLTTIGTREFYVAENDYDLSLIFTKFADAERVSLDTETTGLDVFGAEFGLVGLVVTPNEHQGYYIPVAHQEHPELARVGAPLRNLGLYDVAEVLTDALKYRRMLGKPPIYMHNASYDRLVLKNTMGIDLDLTPAFDTAIAAQLLDENQSMSLKALAKRYLGAEEEHSKFLLDEVAFAPLVDYKLVAHVSTTGRSISKKTWYLRDDWRDELLKVFVDGGHNGAVSFKYMTTLNQKLMAFLKAHKIVDFKGLYSAGFAHIPVEIGAIYALDDGFNTWELGEFLRNVFFPLGNAMLEELFEQVQMPVDDVMTRATLRGVQVDRAQLEKMRDVMAQRMHELESEALRLADVLIPTREEIVRDEHGNPTGTIQVPVLDRELVLTSHIALRSLLFDELGYAVIDRTANGAASTSKEVLEKLVGMTPARARFKTASAKRFLELKLQLGELQKMHSTYTDSLLDKLDAQDRIHANFNVIGAVSGRMSSNNPNMQNIPRLTPEEVEERPWLEGVDIRSVFVADPGYVFVSCDFDAMEMVGLAGLSGDENLARLLHEGRDLHAHTARLIYKVGETLTDKEFKKQYPLQRQRAKTVNFLLAYAGNEWTIMNRLGVDKKEAQQLYNGFFEAFPKVKTWMDKVFDTLETQREISYPEFGFVKHLDAPDPELELRDAKAYRRQYQAALRTSQNATIQGWCAFVMKQALVEIDRDLKDQGWSDRDAQVVLQVHDEGVVLCREEHALQVGAIMQARMTRDFNGVKLTASPEYKRSLSKAAPAVPREELERAAARTITVPF